MSRLQFIFNDLQETAVALADLQGKIAKDPNDDILRVNAETLSKRHHDLEQKLVGELRGQQLDLIQCQIETRGGGSIPAVALTSTVLLFQQIVTSIFDAVRDRPKQTYSPLPENVALSTMTLASAKLISPIELSLTIPNDRLLALKSDLDVTFGIALDLLQSHKTDALRQMAERVGISPLSQTYQWAANSVEHRLKTSIRWQKSANNSVAIVVSANDALLLHTTIGSVYIERLADFDAEVELIALDDDARSFVARGAAGPFHGSLDLRFPGGGRWVTHRRYAAALTRLIRIHCSDGQEETYWTLRKLADRS